MAYSIHMGELMCIMIVSVTNGAWMAGPQLRVLPRPRWMVGVLCRGINVVVIHRVGLLASSLRLVFSLIPTSLLSSLPFLGITTGLIRECYHPVSFLWLW